MTEAMYGMAALEWPLMVAAAAIFGTAAFALILRRIDEARAREVAAAMIPAWRAMAAVAALAAPLVIVEMTAEMAATGWRDALGMVPQVLVDTHAGRQWAGISAASLILLAITILPVGESVRPHLVLLAAAFILIRQAAAGHAIDHGRAAVAIYFIHEAAAGLWIGALAGFRVAMRTEAGDGKFGMRAARAVSSIAASSVAAIVLTGAVSAWIQIGLNIDRLLFSTYGRTLMVKVVAFGAAISIGAYNRERLVPAAADRGGRAALVRMVGAESVLLMGVVMALATLLANTPPASGHMMMHSRIAPAAAFLAIAVVLVLPGCRRERQRAGAYPASEKADCLPDLTLTDQSGNRVSLSSLKGKPVLFDFIYTSCPGPCEMLTARMKQVAKRVGPMLGTKVWFVSVSVDPEHDTPERMREYAREQGADQQGWLFLTGTPDEVERVMRRFKLVRRREADGTVDHVLEFFLVGGDGRELYQYVGTEASPATIAGDIEEAARTGGVSTHAGNARL